MSLHEAPKGKSVKIVSVEASPVHRNRLSALGILPGTDVKVVDNSLLDATLVNCKGSRLVLGRGLPSKIEVK